MHRFISILSIIASLSLPHIVFAKESQSGEKTTDSKCVSELVESKAMNNYFIAQYLNAREGYNASYIQRDYPVVRVMSEINKVYPTFINEVNPRNPGSVIARLGKNGTRKIEIMSIIYPTPKTAQARILIKEDAGKNVVTEYDKTVKLTFEYVKLALTDAERLINPLGFRIIEYQLQDTAVTK
jgi:type IV secretion system protein VirB8